MNLADFAARLDDLFAVRSFDERHGWDFALTPKDNSALLGLAGESFAACFNGLLGAPDASNRELGRVYLLVFPEASLVDQVIAAEKNRGQPGAVIVTHHPCRQTASD